MIFLVLNLKYFCTRFNIQIICSQNFSHINKEILEQVWPTYMNEKKLKKIKFSKIILEALKIRSFNNWMWIFGMYEYFFPVCLTRSLIIMYMSQEVMRSLDERRGSYNYLLREDLFWSLKNMQIIRRTN